jgi:signal transduction histidine kinase
MLAKAISVEDLIEECNFTDPAEFRRVLKRRSLPVPSSGKPIKREVANQIALALLGRTIDWSKYEQMERDKLFEGPLRRRRLAGMEDAVGVEQWYQKLQPGRQDAFPQKDFLLGVAFSGGFLGGANKEEEFVLGLQPGINVLIGHRGAGKSTILNLLGLIADSVSEETDVLFNKLLELLKTNPEGLDVTRRVRRTLKQYGVDRYACYYIKDGQTVCYLVNIHETAYDMLERAGGEWHSQPDEKGVPTLKMQMLRQGEVVRISEEREKYYLNNLLDTLYPELYGKRDALAKLIKKVSAQSDSYRSNKMQVGTARISRFIGERSDEVRRVVADIQRGHLSGDSIQLIVGYLKRIHQVKRHELPPTIAQLLKGEEDSFYQLYLGRILPFLNELAGRLERLQERQAAMAEEFYRGFDEPPVDEGDMISHEMQEELDEDKEIMAEMEVTEFGGGDDEGDGPPLNASLFTEALEAESNNPVNREMLAIGRRVVDLLITRLRLLRTWTRIYSTPRLEWNASLDALVSSCVQLLQQRSDLISLQQERCQHITRVLNEDELEIKIFTRGAADQAAKHRADIDGLRKLSTLYDRLFSATPFSRLRLLRNAATECDEYLERVRSVMGIVKNVVESNQQDEFLFIPVEVDLRQGGTYRHFGQLSFGQKSGIILKMVLLTGDEGVVIIDQPEDNLDANSINMLAPTLNHLGKNRQVVIATHNSNLVLTLETENLVVLESQGETGKVKASGPLGSKRLVSEMLDILEGGVDTFALKMSTYEQFITRVRGEIQDMDLQLIESSFRRRTIDNLRNFLQPIVSDKSILDFARHELHQGDKVDLQSHLAAMRKVLGGSDADGNGGGPPELLERLDTLFGRLESYIKRLDTAINDIRMMDTKARPQDVDLYALLAELRTEYLEQIDKQRLIEIDLDERLKGRRVHADEDHLRLVLRNLLNNSFRATERKVIDNLGTGADAVEAVRLKLLDAPNNRVAFLYMDNGCGIPPEIKAKLYVESCTDQPGSDHGLGGVIIRKLLNLNGGAIQVLDGYPVEQGFVTVQQVNLPGEKSSNHNRL